MSMERIFGGNPAGVIIRLIILSVVVGIVLMALGIRFENLFYHLQILVRRIYDLGFDAVYWLLQPFLVGAAIVIPIWLLARLFGAFRSPRDKA
ncbi:MAG: integrase [Hyphomicrobiaceae bacterium]|nr:integrase [Hyphomicrobiaceae bacterium]